MRSSISLAALVPLAACGGGAELPRTTPTGALVGHYDAVGYASWYGEELAGATTASGAPFDPDAITAAHRTLPLGSYVEVTALDTGRAILVLVNDRGPGRADRLIDLSRGAANLLGTGGRSVVPVRVRAVGAASADIRALAAGRPATERYPAPPAMLAPLRRRLPPDVARSAPQPARSPADVARSPASTTGYLVQVATFSGEGRARALAARLSGNVSESAGFYRVRLGPYADSAAATRARDAAALRGYGDAVILVQP